MTTLWPSVIPEGLQNAWEHLVWARDCAIQLQSPASLDVREFDAQRYFFYGLMHFDIVRKQLVRSAEKFNRADVAQGIQRDSKNDPLLNYYRHARNATTHHFLRFTQTVSVFAIAIVDLNRAAKRRGNLDEHAWRTALLCEAFGVDSFHGVTDSVRDGKLPSQDKLVELGIDFKLETHVDLAPFTYVDETNKNKPVVPEVLTPHKHRGIPTIGSAEQTIGHVGRYYTHYLHVLAIVAGCAPDETCLPFPRVGLARMRPLKPPRSRAADSPAGRPR